MSSKHLQNHIKIICFIKNLYIHDIAVAQDFEGITIKEVIQHLLQDPNIRFQGEDQNSPNRRIHNIKIVSKKCLTFITNKKNGTITINFQYLYNP